MRVAAATVITSAGLGLAGLNAAGVAEAFPGPLPDYHWCPGQFWDPSWGPNWGADSCHDDFYFDGEPHDPGHWHGPAPGTPESMPLAAVPPGAAALLC